MIQNRKSVQYGGTRNDGAKRVFWNGKPAGWLMPGASQATLESSPGIQGWSHPRGKVATRLWEGNAVAIFASHWERKWKTTYPLSS
jgi:hypothetical protein